MCELFAMNAVRPVAVNDLLAEFYGHSHQHPHGWGLSWREGDEVRLLKEPVPAYTSKLLEETLSQPIMATHLIGHIRKATHGICAMCNCHPFVGTDSTGDEWIMAHNGVMLNESLLAGYDERECGETDSERVMLFLLDVLDTAAERAGGIQSEHDRFEALASATKQLSNGNKLNLVMDDGQTLFVHTNTDEITLFYQQFDGYVVVSTKPLGAGAWLPVPQRRLIAFQNGRLSTMSTAHLRGFADRVLPYLQFPVSSAGMGATA